MITVGSLRVRPIARAIRRQSNHRAGSCTPLPDALKNSLRQAEFLRPGQGLAILLPLRLAFKHLLGVTHPLTHSAIAPVLSLRHPTTGHVVEQEQTRPVFRMWSVVSGPRSRSPSLGFPFQLSAFQLSALLQMWSRSPVVP